MNWSEFKLNIVYIIQAVLFVTDSYKYSTSSRIALDVIIKKNINLGIVQI